MTDDWHCVATPNEERVFFALIERVINISTYVAVRENYFHLVFCILITYVVFCCMEKFSYVVRIPCSEYFHDMYLPWNQT